MSNETTKSLDKFDAPFNKQIELIDVSMENDVSFLRVRIKEGSRFTIIDLDPVTAKFWGERMIDWASSHMDAG